jgi:galactitol PTS system EIIA component
MSYNLVDLLRVQHILIGLDASDAEDAIRKSARPLMETGFVGADFADDVWRREQSAPTGLPTEPFAVAIPHADPDHIFQTALGISVLRSPVAFHQMGADSSVLVDAHIVFLLAIKERDKQVEMIQQLVTLIQSASLLEQLASAGDVSAAMAFILAALR